MLCFLLTFCVGFLSISSDAYAFEKEDNFYPLVDSSSQIKFYGDNWSKLGQYFTTVNGNKMTFNNPLTNNIKYLTWESFIDNSTTNSPEIFTFPFNPDLYEYYFLGTVVGKYSNVSESTFKPTAMEVLGYDFATNTKEWYPLNSTVFYDIDTGINSGFGWYTKIDFGTRDNIGMHSVTLHGDKDGTGSKPANLIWEMGVLAVEKGNSETATLTDILNQLQKMETSITENIQNGSNSITSAVGESAEKISGTIEEQYDVEEGEDFEVDSIAGEVEEKLGVLSVGADTLVGFLDLFDASSAGSTTITFPAFNIEVGGESYNVWNDITFDLAVLEENFGVLIGAVRTVTVLCVWLAVLSYLIKAKDHIITNRG